MSAAAILDFQNFKFLTADTRERPNLRHPAKFHQDRSLRCRDMAIVRFFKMAAVRHLGFRKVRLLRFDTVRSVHVRHCAKFGQNRSNDCEDITI